MYKYMYIYKYIDFSQSAKNTVKKSFLNNAEFIKKLFYVVPSFILLNYFRCDRARLSVIYSNIYFISLVLVTVFEKNCTIETPTFFILSLVLG